MLIANTTETEFKSVLVGLCKQTKSFKTECLSIVDQYYADIYHVLINNLNGNEACCAIQICPRNVGSKVNMAGDIMPMLPIQQAQHIEVTITAKPKPAIKLLGENEPLFSAQEIQNAQLPIDKLMGAPTTLGLVENGNYCLICEYILHYIQDTMATEKYSVNCISSLL